MTPEVRLSSDRQDGHGMRDSDRRDYRAFAIRSLALLIAKHRLPGSSPLPLETVSAQRFIDDMIRDGWLPPAEEPPLLPASSEDGAV